MTATVSSATATVFATDDVGRRLSRELAAALPTDGSPCVIGACGRERCDAFAEVAAECDTAGTPFFVVELATTTLRLSPVYGRDYGSCYHCRVEAMRAVPRPFDHAEPVPAGWLPQHLAFTVIVITDVVARLGLPDQLPRAHRMLDLFDNTLSSAPSEGVAHA